jgi:transcriptional regulator with XRE-family HTH domain
MNDITSTEIKEFHKMIGKNVKYLRELNGLSQIELSLEIGQKSTTIISQAELGKGKRFNIEHLYKIAKVLDSSVSELVSKDISE